MRLRNQISSLLLADHNFYSWAELHFHEKSKNLEAACNQIIRSVIQGINIQINANERIKEIGRIARECASLEFNTSHFSGNAITTIKGKGANSEIFGDRFGNIVNVITRQTMLKGNTVYELFLILTPVILRSFYFNYKAKNYNDAQIGRYIYRNARCVRIPALLNDELVRLIEKDTNTKEETPHISTATLHLMPPANFWNRFNRVFRRYLPELS